jgi:anti-sigma B factor antagonist
LDAGRNKPGAPTVSPPTPTTDNPLGFEAEQLNGVQVLRFRNAKILSESSLNEMGNRLLASLEACENPPRIAISFAGVSFLSSAAVGKLILLQRKVKERNGELKLCDLSASTYDVFRIARLSDYFDIRPDLNSALSAFS